MEINISDLSKNKVLRALFNASKQQGIGLLDIPGQSLMADEEAQGWIDKCPARYFDYLKGRVMKVDLSGESFDPRLFDRDNGEGAAERAINALRQATKTVTGATDGVQIISE